MEEGIHGGNAVESHEVQLELAEPPFAAEILVITLRAFLQTDIAKQV